MRLPGKRTLVEDSMEDSTAKGDGDEVPAGGSNAESAADAPADPEDDFLEVDAAFER